MGDPAHQIPLQALPGVVWHDLMTYCDYQWLSSFTYQGIRDRLVAENQLPGGPSPGGPGAPAAAPGAPGMLTASPIHVVATVDVTASTGKFRHVTPVPGGAPSGPTPGAAAQPLALEVRVLRADGSAISAYSAPFYPDACRGPNDHETGIVDMVIPGDPAAAELDLLLGTKVLDRFRPAVRAMPVKDIRSVAPLARAMGIGPPVRSVIAWTDDTHALAAAVAGPAGTAHPPTYMVQLSTDDGKTWRTIGMGLTRPQVTVDRHVLAGAHSIKVRVTATDGFHSETTVKDFSPAEF